MINLYYDDALRGNGSTLTDSPVRSSISINQHLSKLEFPYKIHKLDPNTVIDSNHLNLFVIELMYGNRIEEVFNNISANAYNFLKQNVKLLIYFPYEGFELTLYDNWFLKIHQAFIAKKITCKKYFVFNNLDIENRYTAFLQEHNIPEEYRFNKVFGLPFFEFEYYHTLKEQILNGEPQVNLNNLMNKSVDFLCLNSKIRAHRLFLISELQRRNIIENSYSSMMGSNFVFEETTLEYAKQILEQHFKLSPFISEDMINHSLNYINNWRELILDASADNLNDRYLDPKYYENSHFSLVTETGMGYLSLTEKPLRAIANYHPYILISSHGALKYLKSIGFETFPEFFDESYDDEPNPAKRLLMVIDEVEKFVHIPNSRKNELTMQVKDKLIHNRNLFFSVIPKRIETEFKSIFNFIQHD